MPSSDATVEMDFHLLKPRGVAVYATRVFLEETRDPGEKVKALGQMEGEIPRAAQLLAAVEPQLIAFCCTSGAFLDGARGDRRIAQAIEDATGVSAITTASALAEAIRVLGATTNDLLTPYSEEVAVKAAEYLQMSLPGLVIHRQRHLGIVSGIDKCGVSPLEILREGKALASDEGEALVISCTALPCLPIVTELEHDIMRPVVTSNLATMWLALRRLGVQEPVLGRGQLLCAAASGSCKPPGHSAIRRDAPFVSGGDVLGHGQCQ